jgi:hypothetical protein
MVNTEKSYILILKVIGRFCKVGKHLSDIVISPFCIVNLEKRTSLLSVSILDTVGRCASIDCMAANACLQRQ